jgi:hypothetical protein
MEEKDVYNSDHAHVFCDCCCCVCFSIRLFVQVYCIDSKLNFDENADFRHSDIFKMRDFSQEDQREVVATKAGLHYIGLDGNIGCVVNGAGTSVFSSSSSSFFFFLVFMCVCPI